jgi:tocopherol O-methyltransferase
MIRAHHPPDTAAIINHYEELDRFYREVWGEHIHHGLWRTGLESPAVAVEQLIAYVSQQAGLSPQDEVCDIGAGYGATARWLVQHHRVQVTALTVVPTQYTYARSVNPTMDGNPRYLLGDWLTNRLPDNAFDVALGVESIEHMVDLEHAFQEIYRVLRPGGRFVLCTWSAAETPTSWQRRYLLEPICGEARLIRLCSEAEHRELLIDAGLKIDSSEDLSAHVQQTWTVCLRRSASKLFHNPQFRRFLRSRRSRNRIFLITLGRMRWAYGCGALRYILFRGHRP